MPQPSLVHLDVLLGHVRGAGLPVELRIEGEPRELSPGVDASAYRIVQEALTNALKHAGPARADVTVRYGTDTLELEVADDGAGSANGDGAGTRADRHARAGGDLRRRRRRRVAARGRLRRAREAAAVIRVLLADDQRLVRSGFRMILRADPGLDVVGEAGDGVEAVALARELRPDVVLMDVRMPRLDGIEATRQLLREQEPPRVLVLTTFDLDEYVYAALRAGASGFLLKDAPEEQLAAAIRVAADGGALFSPGVTRRLIERFTALDPDVATPPRLDELTARELEVLRLIARGLSNAEIAAELVVSDHTVKTHVARVLAKLDLRDRTQAVIAAYESGSSAPAPPRPAPTDSCRRPNFSSSSSSGGSWPCGVTWSTTSGRTRATASAASSSLTPSCVAMLVISSSPTASRTAAPSTALFSPVETHEFASSARPLACSRPRIFWRPPFISIEATSGRSIAIMPPPCPPARLPPRPPPPRIPPSRSPRPSASA